MDKEEEKEKLQSDSQVAGTGYDSYPNCYPARGNNWGDHG